MLTPGTGSRRLGPAVAGCLVAVGAIALSLTLRHPGGEPNAGVAPAIAAATRTAAPQPAPTRDPRAEERAEMLATLQRAVRRAADEEGTVEAAVVAKGWRAPAIAGSGDLAGEPGRMWSVSKVATAVTMLRSIGWGDRPGAPVPPELRDAMTGALTRSENCRQRRVVLGLQERAGSPAGAARMIEDTFASAGTAPTVAHATLEPDPSCLAYLGEQHGLETPLAPALALGTSRWRIGDAARFALALGTGRYGTALQDEVLGLMRLPKEPSRESPRADFTAALDWGAGAALACLHPAYKAGWGGSLLGSFAATQIAIVERRGHVTALAVRFVPAAQPPRDDPGLTRAPAVLEQVMGAVAPLLDGGRGCGRHDTDPGGTGT